MHKLLEGLPRYSSEDSEIEAALFNEVKLAMLRLEDRYQFQLPGLRTLEMIIDKDSWICIDRSLNNMPVFAWTEFQTQNRTSLHEPIACKLFYYHQHAERIVDKVKQEIHNLFDKKLHPDTNS
ncbi:MAG: hypothetical protein OEZ58_12625 [Gammaproteobacteria bacterium]|nr:hypothetical protein [Gammaproteobacteria bacterium]MDH5729831.1 hypothetical protein [Gammaproteobacteria bacterium]